MAGRRAILRPGMDAAGFFEAHLPPAPARLLEVGCGRGELALTLAARGYAVVAIDPQAPAGDIFRAVTLEDFTDPDPFDAVIADRSLHHIADLARATDKVRDVVVPGGRVLVREHAWERFDERTAEWYAARRAAHTHHASDAHEHPVADWRADHAGLHDSDALRSELDRRFTRRFFAWTPYLYGELGGADTEREERALINAGAIQATGFVYVGERTV
jgi:SAM-dependent methyltransferase